MIVYNVCFVVFFQFGTCRIEIAEQSKEVVKFEEGEVADDSLNEENSEEPPTGHAIMKLSTISKEDLVLVPNGIATPKAPLLPRNRSYNTLKHEFNMSDCLDYINAGMEAIIEDEVTQRFVAEELKVWIFYFLNKKIDDVINFCGYP